MPTPKPPPISSAACWRLVAMIPAAGVLGPGDLYDLGGDLVGGDVFHAGAGGDLHGDVAQQLLEHVTAGDEVGLAVHFHQHTHAGSGVDVTADGTFGRNATRLLLSGGNALLAQPFDGLGGIAGALREGLLASHHSCAGLVAQFLDELCRNLSHGGMGNGKNR